VLGATDILRWVKGRSVSVDASPAPRTVDRRLTGAVMGALREAFDRDHARIELERQRMEQDRLRAERAMRLELLRQAGEREVGRLRLVAGVAVVSLLGSLLLITRLAGGAIAPRLICGLGWSFLIAALAAAFAAQTRVGQALDSGNDRVAPGDITASPGGRVAAWLVVAGLASITIGALLV
jgi:hypothetical protein